MMKSAFFVAKRRRLNRRRGFLNLNRFEVDLIDAAVRGHQIPLGLSRADR